MHHSAVYHLTAFTLSALYGFTKADQQTAFRRLHEEIVLATNPGDAIEEMIDYMYAGLSSTQVEDFVVPGWDTDDVSRDFYRNVLPSPAAVATLPVWCRATLRQSSRFSSATRRMWSTALAASRPSCAVRV
jgi:hypothetical protein